MISYRYSKYALFIFKNRLLCNLNKTSSKFKHSLDIVNTENNQLSSKYKLHTNDEFTASELSNVVNNNLNWVEEFGTLSNKPYEQIEEDDEDSRPYVRLSKINRKHTPDWYARKISSLGKQNMIYEAIDVLETEMLVTDRVMPNEFVFTALIGTLGRVGYTKKAFQLFNKMKKFGIIPSSHTYTSLFNACSNSPDTKEGLEMVKRLRDLMKEKEIEMNQITFQAMVKAYSRLGDIKMAFACIDDAMGLRMKLDENMFSFLLMACISDKENGFNLALRVWLMILTSKANISIYHINLILKAATNCEMGNEQQINDLLKTITEENINKIKTKLQIKHILPQVNNENYSINESLCINNLSENNINGAVNIVDLKLIELPKHDAHTFNIENKLSVNSDKKYTSLDFSNLQAITKKSKAIINKDILSHKEYNITEMLQQSLQNKSQRNLKLIIGKRSKELAPSIVKQQKSNVIDYQSESNNMLPNDESNNMLPNDKTLAKIIEPVFIPTINTKELQSTSNSTNINLLFPTNVPNIKGINLPLSKSDKLVLIGGLKGFLSLMNTFKLEPNLKTVSLLLKLIPCDKTIGKEEESFLLNYIAKKNIILDVTFYNLLIRTRNLRRDFESAKKVISLMNQMSIEPNIRTFGCLAMGCTKKSDALQLIADMQKINIAPTVEICEILLTRSKQDFDYKLDILKKMKEIQIRPSHAFLNKIEDQVKEARIIITRIEQNKDVKPMYLMGKFQDGYRRFVMNYKSWLQHMQLEPNVHPWDPYKQPTIKNDDFIEEDINK